MMGRCSVWEHPPAALGAAVLPLRREDFGAGAAYILRFSFLEKMKVAAFPAAAQRLGAGKADLSQPAVGHIICVAK